MELLLHLPGVALEFREMVVHLPTPTLALGAFAAVEKS